MEEPTNGRDPEPVEEQSMVSMCQFKCGSCQNVMVARSPVMRVYNFPEGSGVVVPHERMAKCPTCSTIYVPLIGEVSQDGRIKLVWKPIQTKESGIVAPSFNDVKQVSKTKKQ